MALVKITDPELAYTLWQNGMLYNEAGHLWGAYMGWAEDLGYRHHTADRVASQLQTRAYTYTED